MWYEFSNKRITKELIDAKKRGVDVKICLGKSMLDTAADTLVEFLEADIEVEVAQEGRVLLVKIALLDDTVMLGSANMSVNAFQSNIEDIVLFHGLERKSKDTNNVFAAVG
ncbi:hypothetical protein JG688_00017138 [Phytophthora aleatoria]|uniref:Mitochondrial cardiolipin hydrolase n=1 Tax=Phytophthora aleatoria TaxID=2496075 RepID=A0A8J5I347_9STRA|nr:hypothetical protein JG688_00017138 [Phytophthora aleatoria]